MATFTFVLKEPQIDRKKPIDKKTGRVTRIPLNEQVKTPILLLIRWGSDNRIKISTEKKILPEYWNEQTRRVIITKSFPQGPDYNLHLKNMEVKADAVFTSFVNENKRPPSEDELRQLCRVEFGKEEKGSQNLFSFIEKFIEEARMKVNGKTGKMFSPVTITAYRNTYNILKAFKQDTRKRLDFDTIDLDFYHDIKEYLMNERTEEIIKDDKPVLIKKPGMALNTVGKQIKNIKVFLNEATERGLNTNLSYKSKRFKVISEETDSIYLNEKELNAIYKLDLSDKPRLERSRDLFLIGCWTGLRFSDFTNISPNNIKGDMIEIKPKKTAKPVMIPIHKTIKQIMAKYKGQYDNSLPPAISNVKLNLNIKEVCKLVPTLNVQTSSTITKGGMQVTENFKKYELVTTHTARRSFATNQYKDKVPAITIMQITGHKTEKAFLKYIKVTPDEHAKILQLHWQNKNKLRAV